MIGGMVRYARQNNNYAINYIVEFFFSSATPSSPQAMNRTVRYYHGRAIFDIFFFIFVSRIKFACEIRIGHRQYILVYQLL